MILNLIYNHWTPHGPIQNGLSPEKVKSIFKNALKKKEPEYYSGDLKEYIIKFSKNLVSVIHYDKIHDTKIPQNAGYSNLFILEDIDKFFYMSDEMVDELKHSDNYYFVVFNKSGQTLEKEFYDYLIEFKQKFLVNKTRILYISPTKPTTNIYWSYIKLEDGEMDDSRLLNKINEKIETINKTRFL